MACGFVYKVDLVGSGHRLLGQETLYKDFSVGTRRLFLFPWAVYTRLGAALFLSTVLLRGQQIILL